MAPARPNLSAVGAALLVATASLSAQRVARPRPEVRLDAIAARVSSVQTGVGVALPVGTYTRLVGVVAGGMAVQDGRSAAAARADLTTRFVLDPFGESRWALYGAGGVSVLYDEFERWRPVISATIGIEGAHRGRVAPAFEFGLGGGIRVGMALRGVRGGYR